MRVLVLAILLAVSVGSGCARKKHAAPKSPGAVGGSPNQNFIVTPDTSLSGKVSSVNVEGRFVVLTFPPGHLPTPEQQLNIYRRGLKTGVVKVTGQQLNENVIADIINGDAAVGDEAREK